MICKTLGLGSFLRGRRRRRRECVAGRRRRPRAPGRRPRWCLRRRHCSCVTVHCRRRCQVEVARRARLRVARGPVLGLAGLAAVAPLPAMARGQRRAVLVSLEAANFARSSIHLQDEPRAPLWFRRCLGDPCPCLWASRTRRSKSLRAPARPRESVTEPAVRLKCGSSVVLQQYTVFSRAVSHSLWTVINANQKCGLTQALIVTLKSAS